MKAEKKIRSEEIELRPDGWERFEKAVDAAVRTPPVRRITTPAPHKGRDAPKERATKGRART